MGRTTLIGLSVLLLVTTACGSPPSASVPPAEEGNVQSVEGDDSAMNAAMAQARSTLPQFKAELAAPHAGASYTLKARLQDGDAIEHIWLNEVLPDGSDLVGTINNDPVQVKNVKIGQRIRVTPEQVSDWLVVENGKYRGGFTIRYFRAKMSASEQHDLDEQMGAVPE